MAKGNNKEGDGEKADRGLTSENARPSRGPDGRLTILEVRDIYEVGTAAEDLAQPVISRTFIEILGEGGVAYAE